MNAPDAWPEWRALAAHQRRLARLHLRTLFERDDARAQRYAAEGAAAFVKSWNALLEGIAQRQGAAA